MLKFYFLALSLELFLYHILCIIFLGLFLLHILCTIFLEKCFSYYIQLTDQISLSDCFYFFR